MTSQEKTIYNFCGKHADWWPSTSQIKEMVVLLQKDWKGLTVKEVGAIEDKEGKGYIPQKQLQFYADIWAKLKEKNA